MLSRTTSLALFALLLVLGTAGARSEVRKENVRVSVTIPVQGQSRQLVVLVRGLYVSVLRDAASRPGPGWVTHDTLAAPFTLAAFGLGDIELRGVDSTADFTVRVEGVNGSATPVSVLTGRRVQVLHARADEIFTLAPLEPVVPRN